MTCAYGCGRTMRPLNPRRQYHPLCREANRAQARRVWAATRAANRAAQTGAAVREAEQIEAMFQAARAARRAA